MEKSTNVVENNTVIMDGEICSEGMFSHEVYGEKFYLYNLKVNRRSEASDTILLTISERLAKQGMLTIGTNISITGQFRSFNKREETKNHLILSVFVREIYFIEEDEKRNDNKIMLKGTICKKPVYRETPLGRQICDLLIAVNRPYGKSDYIPCICWTRNAKFASELEVGQTISAEGRIQSRNYMKRIGPNEEDLEKRTAYEVSISKISV